jgi:transcriptional regulator with XRE-family HTH domain
MGVSMTNRNAQPAALADFLKSRRARISPADIGWTKAVRRRVPGLRREEVAELAEVGVTWYTWLEQARNINVSIAVLERLALALKLKAEEREHLFLLAGYAAPLPLASSEENLMSTAKQVLTSLDPSPAIILNRRWDVIAWNSSAAKIFGDFALLSDSHRNWVWLTFSNASFRKLFKDWDRFARCVVAHFRADSTTLAKDPHWIGLISTLSDRNEKFREWWLTHEVASALDWRKELRHPVAGVLFLNSVHFEFPRPSSLKLVAYTACPETDTQERLLKLASKKTRAN